MPKLSPAHLQAMIAGRRASRPSLAARFWAKVDKNGPVFQDKGRCWVWTSAEGRKHGVLFLRGRTDYAHRVVFELIGQEIPAGMHVDHICRNKMCVNPDHLRFVTPQQNALENNSSPFARNAQKTHCERCNQPLSGENLALVPHRDRLNRHGNPRKTPLKPTRQCLTCYPQYWMHAVIPRDPPPRARKQSRKVHENA